MRLAIGTAQFGRGYGVANKSGKISEYEVGKIFKIAKLNNIDMFDTAEDYGDSEDIIGKMSCEFNIDSKVVTKVFVNPDDRLEFDMRLRGSLESLRTNQVHGLLAHDPKALIEDARVFEILSSVKDLGLSKKIGVSVSTPEQVDIIMNKHDVDIIQVPCNLFDQRFLASNTIKNLVEYGVEVHIRSVFLQGLFFIDKLNNYFDDIRGNIDSVRLYAHDNSLSIGEMALGFVSSILGIDRIIVGMDSSDHFVKMINDYGVDINCSDFERFSICDDRFINPGRWNVGGWHK